MTSVVLLLLVFPLSFPYFRTFLVSPLPLHLLLCVFHLYFLALGISAIAGFQSPFRGPKSCHVFSAVSVLSAEAQPVRKVSSLIWGQDRVLRLIFPAGRKAFQTSQKCLLTSIDEKGSLDGQFKLVKGQHRVWWIPSTGCHPLAHTRYFALELFSPSHYWLWTVHAFKCWSKCSWVSLSPEGKLLAFLPLPNNINTTTIFYL